MLLVISHPAAALRKEKEEKEKGKERNLAKAVAQILNNEDTDEDEDAGVVAKIMADTAIITVGNESKQIEKEEQIILGRHNLYSCRPVTL